MNERILVVDDDPKIVELLQMRLESKGYKVDTAGDGEAALERLQARPADMVITDLKMPKMDGLELLRRLRRQDTRMLTIFLTAHGSIVEAVQAMKLGAYDFLEKPYRGADLLRMVERAFQDGRTDPPEIEEQGDQERLVGESAAMQRVNHLIDRIAATPSNVLITGESGTGKELAAATVHRKSLRSEDPFVIIDCGALPDTLLESELFGHRKGSFTNATQDKRGLLEVAHNGTVFLDEIGNISSSMQTRLLRFLQNGEVRRIGDVNPRQVDVRVIAATNRDLEAGTADGTFREDLYYRLKVVTIHLPPLRERRDDIESLATHFLAQSAATMRRDVREIAPPVMERLKAHRWQGNVRELKHVIEAAVALSRGESLELQDFLQADFITAEPEAGSDDLTALEQAERDQILKALRENNWVQKRAADLLGISGRVIHYKIRKYGIQIPRSS